MKTKRTVFLTGATGFLGSYLLKVLLENGHRVYCLARPKGGRSAHERVEEFLKFWDEDVSAHNRKRLRVVEGDITQTKLGIKASHTIQELISEVEVIFHSAAIPKLTLTLDAARKVNVEGTKNVLDFALMCRKLRKVNHISTAYVVGTKAGVEFSEDMLDVGQSFHNTYEQTKYEAEKLACKYIKKGLNISIFRPSMVIGDSQEGKTTDFRLFYEPLHFFAQGIYERFPADLECRQNLINIDTVAGAVSLLGEDTESTVYHIVSPSNVKVGVLLSLVSEYFGFKVPECVPLDMFDFSLWTPVQKELAGPFIPYFNQRVNFSCDKTRKILRKYGFDFPSIDKNNLLRIFEYCDRRGFIKRDEYGYTKVD